MTNPKGTDGQKHDLDKHVTHEELVTKLEEHSKKSHQEYLKKVGKRLDEITGYGSGVRNLKNPYGGYDDLNELILDNFLELEKMRYGDMEFEVIFSRQDRVIPEPIRAYNCPECDTWVIGSPEEWIYKKGTTAEQIANESISKFSSAKNSERKMGYQCHNCGYTRTDGEFKRPDEIKLEEAFKEIESWDVEEKA